MSEPEINWISTKAAADYLGITSRTLYRMIDDGQVPAYKFGRVIRLKQAEVDTFIEASRVEPGSLKHLYPDAASKGGEGSAEDAAEATGRNMAYDEVEGVDRDAISKGDVPDA